MLDDTVTRAHGLSRPRTFLPAVGRRYANRGHYDRELGKHSVVSTLRRRTCLRRVQFVLPDTMRGTLQDGIAVASPFVAARCITRTEWRRDWDSEIWLHASADYSRVMQHIPHPLSHAALT